MITNHFSATMKFTHGDIKVEGTIIFILATIADMEKREGFLSTTKNRDLQEALDLAEERRSQMVG